LRARRARCRFQCEGSQSGVGQPLQAVAVEGFEHAHEGAAALHRRQLIRRW